MSAYSATSAERAERRPGDDLVTPADVVMDRGFTVDAPPELVWPWLVQLGKRRAGWYLPRRVERFLPPSRRALRRLDPRWSTLTSSPSPGWLPGCAHDSPARACGDSRTAGCPERCPY
ncbi:hypothetical protein AMES_3733 [Amycolatopsis mediterranei S699]|uniref:Uncharacterized protein n=2 Tax=Amycolatopsis mediterranei TaxID=33910 RepID=A0A0H3D5J7_AMYMU|nr:hypothetical protein [Amycolatopsis mediterranei]ADJ45557.1 conserved hypothetical protein [Amycolatopsis mediterranei U32]AEK42333.1 hypothetical protein RAM_19235 [Amycolatopsis mediterranei S699]AFO77269.1 hypothetical protein AMES_3733 [Amycolatopsis mediterranei S699]AGT84397.1 hypothetical protein B737_3733 [Amycolatopsis mediterranei RB]KDO05815.1 hypothetical protein DV26_36245 [Amycolatopsis mediterranei]